MDVSQSRELNEGLWRSSGSYELVAGAALFALLGLWLDRTIGLVPVFTLTFAFAGFLGAGVSIYCRYRNQMAELERERVT